MSTTTATIRIDATAAPCKLRNGDWGIKGRSHRAQQGDTVEASVRTRSGKTWQGTYRIIWAGGGNFIAAGAASADRAAGRRPAARRAPAWECPDDEDMHAQGICCCPR